jgi:hypothetical protein
VPSPASSEKEVAMPLQRKRGNQSASPRLFPLRETAFSAGEHHLRRVQQRAVGHIDETVLNIANLLQIRDRVMPELTQVVLHTARLR